MAEFKVPFLPAKRSGERKSNDLIKSTETDSATNEGCETAEASATNDVHVERTDDDRRQSATPPLPYREPLWSGIAEEPSSLEVIKNGFVLNEIDLNQKAFFVFGRLPVCDVVLDHPSISRYHAVLQYRASHNQANGGENSQNQQSQPSSSGFYLYDLGSTHGTVINKEKIRSKTYYRIRAGHVMKFGGSTRLFILQSVGRQDDVERQAEEEIEEVRNERQKREEAREEERRQVEEMRARVIDEGVSWGMGDDDAEEEAQWQFQLGQSEPEIDEDAYYNRDPKKALNHYFEEEGMEVEYEVEEVGQGKDKKFHARIRLPIQTAEDDYIYGEATVAGKKKDAVVACALDACRILDAQGMLRATGAERRKKRERNWEENDFYDSDEDNFFDRTGHVEHKRQIRMMKAGKFQETVETFDSLSKQLAMLQKEIADYEEQLARNRLAASGAVDSLDDYMQHIDIIVDPSTVRKIKQKVSQLRKEELQLQRLVDIARPSSITEFMLDRDNTDAVENPKHTDGHGNMEMSKQSTHKEISSASSRNITVNPGWTKFDENKDIIDSLDGGDHDVTNRVPKENKSLADEITVDKPRVYGPMKPDHAVVESVSIVDVDELEEDDGVEERVEAKRKKRREKRHRMKEKRRLSHGSTSDEERQSHLLKQGKSKWASDDDPEFASWLPPTDQTGDGKTSLNDKLGY